ncbi:MAG: slipin family protein [Pseudomonadales bacterium]|nr:slipin family protein [Pseudomonadales bacterium]
MLFYRKFIVRKHERGLLFKDGDFVRFLGPGTYRFREWRKHCEVERFDLTEPAFSHPLADYLVDAEREDVGRLFTVVATGESEVAVVYWNERVAEVVRPAERKLYWKGPVEIRVDRFDLDEGLAIDAKLAKRLLAEPGLAMASANVGGLRLPGPNGIYSREIAHGHVGLLYVGGELTDSLEPGLHAFWTYGPSVVIEVVDLRVKTLEVQGQEILTRDKVSLRINLTATYRFEDAEKAVGATKDPLDHLYKEIQFGLRGAVGTRTLDALLEDKSAIDRAVADRVGPKFAEIGIAVESVGVKDIILPGDMKELLGRVVEAEKAAQANVIRRREETNATRSLLNTAKVMESNAVALRLKELETLEKVTEKVGNLSVYGGLDGILNELRSLSDLRR